MKGANSILFLILTALLSTVSLQAADNGGVWETAKPISPNSENQRSQIALDCNGNGICVWMDDTSTGTIYAARYTYTSNDWEAPQAIASSENNNMDPQIAIDCNGNGIAVWREKRNVSSAYIMASRYDAATDMWSTATIDDVGNNKDPQIAIDCNGNGIAVWWDSIGSSIQSARYDAATEMWSAVTPIAEANYNYFPQMALDCNGNAICVWYESYGSIYAARYTYTSNDWEDPRLISSCRECDGDVPQIALDCNGDGICVWVSGDGQINTARYNAALNDWETTQTISTSGDNDNPQIAIDCNGNGICVWEDETSADYTIQSARYDAVTDMWSTVTIIDGDGDNRYPQIAIDCNGNAIAVWQDNDNKTIQSARYDAATDMWSTVTTIYSTTVDTPDQSHIAIDCNGNAICVWYKYGGHIWAARYNAALNTWQDPYEVSTPGECDYDGPQIAIDCNGNGICVFDSDDLFTYAARFNAVPAPQNIQAAGSHITWDAITSYTNPIDHYNIYCTPYVSQTPCCENCCSCKIRCCTCPCTHATKIGQTTNTEFIIDCSSSCTGDVTICLTAVDSKGNETPVPGSVQTQIGPTGYLAIAGEPGTDGQAIRILKGTIASATAGSPLIEVAHALFDGTIFSIDWCCASIGTINKAYLAVGGKDKFGCGFNVGIFCFDCDNETISPVTFAKAIPNPVYSVRWCCDENSKYRKLIVGGKQGSNNGVTATAQEFYFKHNRLIPVASVDIQDILFAADWNPFCACKNITLGGGCQDTQACMDNLFVYKQNKCTLDLITSTRFDDNITSVAWCGNENTGRSYLLVGSEKDGWNHTDICDNEQTSAEGALYISSFCSLAATMPQPICSRIN